MPEGPAVAEVLAAHVRERCPNDVDLVAYYGSWARGTATAESDLDIFYVPAEGRDPPLAHSLLVGGRLVDFWPLPWPKLRGFADGTARGWAFAPAVVADARPVYARSDEAVDHLDRLKALVTELQQAAAAPWLLQRDVDATLLGGDAGSASNLRCAHVDAGPVRAAFGLVDLLAIPARALADLANAALDIDAQLLAAAAREGGPPRLETLDDLRAHLREG